MSDVRHIGARSLGVTLAGPLRALRRMRVVSAAFGVQTLDLDAPKAFSFRRHKENGQWQWCVGLHIGPFWTSLTGHEVAPAFATLREARNWVCDFADAHGFPAMERRKRRKPKSRPKPQLRVVSGEVS